MDLADDAKEILILMQQMDSNQFHACCLDTYPPIFYMNDVSKNIIQIITRYNEWAGAIRAGKQFDRFETIPLKLSRTVFYSIHL